MEPDFTIFSSFLPSVTSVGRWMFSADGCVSYFEMIGGCQPVQVSGAPTFRALPIPAGWPLAVPRYLLDFSLGSSSPSTQKFQLSVGRAADGGTFGPLSCGHGVGGERPRGVVGGLTHLFPGSFLSIFETYMCRSVGEFVLLDDILISVTRYFLPYNSKICHFCRNTSMVMI